MTCEWAEGYLSAYLDDALDPQLRKDVGAHIEQCVRCQALTEEYRRNDQLLSTLAPVEPSESLRQSIFESPAFATLARELEREAADAPPGHVSSRRAPLYLRALVPLAALLTVSLGAALLFKQGLLPFGAQTASRTQTNTIGGPGSFDLPLSAGPRLVFLHGGALWSTAEYAPNGPAGAPGTPQRLTSVGARVVAWRVSPLVGSHGGALIAYVDGLTGALHIVRSDGQADTIVGSVSPTQSPSAVFWSNSMGSATLASLSWAPDGSRLAYVAATADGGAQIHIVTPSGSSVAAASSQSPITQLTWSADGRALAGATVNGGVQSVIVWRGGAHAVMLPANPSDTQASATQIAWSGSTLTWAASRTGAIIGVYALPATHTTATVLTASGASYSAAAFTPTHGGVWLLASADTLSEARLASGGVTRVATTSATVNGIVWSPNGVTAAITVGNHLDLWSASAGLTTLAQGATSQPVWSPSGASIAVAQGQNVVVYHVSNDATTQVTQVANSSAVVALT
ncbi:MAG TPA: zf-HC2 domain-containing protein, partial [Ktedonobacterales bacterium]|nr:zf-HC2 domain-containing protein [Ktedonobacterales bacterium]